MGVKVGIHTGVLESDDASSLSKLSMRLEELGFEGVFLADSISSQRLDPLTVLSIFAASTSGISIGTCVYILPLRHPLVTAKTVSSLQQVSGGRLVLGVGVGWRDNEFGALGVPFEKRGRVTDECLNVMRQAWSKDSVNFKGEFFRFEGFELNSRLSESMAPKVWVGGNSRAAIQRAVRYGNGWVPTDLTLDEYKERLPILKKALRQDGRNATFTLASHLALLLDENRHKAQAKVEHIAQMFGETPEQFSAGAIVGDPSSVTERLTSYTELGVNYHVLSTHLLGDRKKELEMLALFSKEVAPSL
jgi:probable F420-dependent oxidoreductase